jgi:hypothetical protein
MEPTRYQNGLMRCDNARFGFKIVKFCCGQMRGFFDDKTFYAFVAIEPQNFEYFEKRYEPYKFSDFTVFGEELLRGWGEEPPQDILEHLKRKHDIQFGIHPASLLKLVGVPLQIQERAKKPSDPFLKLQCCEYPEKPVDALRSRSLLKD